MGAACGCQAGAGAGGANPASPSGVKAPRPAKIPVVSAQPQENAGPRQAEPASGPEPVPPERPAEEEQAERPAESPAAVAVASTGAVPGQQVRREAASCEML